METPSRITTAAADSRAPLAGDGVHEAPIVYRRVDSLVPYARNSRTHDDEQVRQVAAAIREFGFVNPVLIDAAGGILAGHARVRAAQLLGLVEVPCRVLAYLTPAQARAYVIADNAIALNAGWDDAVLRQELAELEALQVDIAVLGFGAAELAALLADVSTDVASLSGGGAAGASPAAGNSSAGGTAVHGADASAEPMCPRCGHVWTATETPT